MRLGEAMSRSGCTDDIDDILAHGRWRGAVRRAMRSKRGQAFLREALAALDAMPDKRLIAGDLVVDGSQCKFGPSEIIVGADELCDLRGNPHPMGSCCLLGAVAISRKLDVSDLDPEDAESVAPRFGIADAMAREVVFWNDEGGAFAETPEQRWRRMRDWVESNIVGDDVIEGGGTKTQKKPHPSGGFPLRWGMGRA